MTSPFSFTLKGKLGFVPVSTRVTPICAFLIHTNNYLSTIPRIVEYVKKGPLASDQVIDYGGPRCFQLEAKGAPRSGSDEAIVIRAFTKRAGSQQLVNWTFEGWCYWSIHHIANAFAQERKCFTLQKPVRMHLAPSQGAALLGTLTLYVDAFEMTDSLPTVLRFGRSYRAKYQELIGARIKEEAAAERALEPYEANSDRVRMVDFKNDITERAGTLPCFAFLLDPTPASTESFFLRIANYIDKRGEMAQYSSLSQEAQTAIYAVRLLTFLPQWLEYQPDYFTAAGGERIEVDRFCNALTTTADDCDGLTRAIIAIHDSLLACYHAGKLHDKRLVSAARILDEYYVPCAMLCGTADTGSASSSSSSSSHHDRGISGAHFAALFLPIDYFVACVKRWLGPHTSNVWSAVGQKATTLPVLYGEGTALVDPYGLEDPAPKLRRHLFTDQVETYGRTDLYYGRRDYGHFVVWPVSLTTNAFLNGRFLRGAGKNVGSFYFADIASKRRARPGRGCPWYSVLTRSADVALMPGPTYTDDEVVYMSVEGSLSAPCPTLVPPSSPVTQVPTSVVDLVSKWAGEEGEKEVRLYIRMENLQGPGLAALRDTLEQNAHRISSVSCLVEHVLVGIVGVIFIIKGH
jgi:hypothetical protein